MDLKSTKTYYKQIFYLAMVASILLMLMLMLVTHGESARSVFFVDNKDSFMDHFNSVVYSYSDDPYANKVMYPPLAMLFYKVMGILVPMNIYDKLIEDPSLVLQPPAMKIYQGFTYGFMIFAVISGILFIFALNEFKQGRKSEKLLFTTLIVLSAPFLFMMDRGNNIIIPLIFSIIFLTFYDSENKVLREIALISLGLAVGFKLYPIAFGALLLKEKHYKELLRAAIYCILFTIVPFFVFYNGFESIGLFFKNISSNSDIRGMKDTDQLNFSKMILYVLNVLRIKAFDLKAVSNIFNYVMTGLSIIGVFTVKERWKSVLLCCCVIYGFPKVTTSYMLVFFILPLVMLLDNEKENKLLTYFYILCFIAIFAPIPAVAPSTKLWTRYAMEKVSSFAVGLATVVAFSEGCKNLFSVLLNKFTKKEVQVLSNERLS
ncbi:MAG: DUF2029 domain-containing protein [Ruminococcaceae bacterium]|nr:DUF2029 domain-containing protein [Oscillospiraceae bacterium]